jgi:hypothetical protein
MLSGPAGKRRSRMENTLTARVGLASAAATTTAAIATSAATAAAAAVFFTRTCFVDSQGAALNFLAGQSRDSCLGGFRRAHADEREPARTSGHAVCDEVDLGDRSMLSEEVLQVVFSCVEGKISHVQFSIHFVSDKIRSACWFPELFPESGFKSSLKRVHLKIHHVGNSTTQSKLLPTWASLGNIASPILQIRRIYLKTNALHGKCSHAESYGRFPAVDVEALENGLFADDFHQVI